MKTKKLDTNIRRGFHVAAAAVMTGVFTMSCSDKDVHIPSPEPQKAVVKASLSGYQGTGQLLDGETDIRHLQACIFEDGRISRIYSSIPVTGRSFDIQIDRHSGNLYLLANTDGLVDLSSLQSENISESDWLRHTIALERGGPSHFYTGKVTLDDKSNVHQVTLTRGVARFDLKVRTAGDASISRITFKNAAESAFLFPVDGEYSPSDVSRNSVSVDFAEPLISDTPGVIYIYEQDASAVEIEVETVIDGKPVTLTKTLSDNIKRNTVYTITVRKDVIDVTLDVTFEEWQPGTDTELVPVQRYL